MPDPTPPDWLRYVTELLLLVRRGPHLSNSPLKEGQGKSPVNPCLSPVLLFSPHPDDESITGLLPLRLLIEEGRPVVNIAVTLGSKKERREARAREAEAACSLLGFSCEHLRSVQEAPERLRHLGADEKEVAGSALVEEIICLLHKYRPALVVYPHLMDLHPAHMAVSKILESALLRFAAMGSSLLAAETECWQPMINSNLAVEGSPQHVAILCQAISLHAGEVARNPYHIRQPVRMMENFFRASELIAGFGGRCERISFAEMYALYAYGKDGRKKRQNPLFLSAEQPANLLFGKE